MALGRFYRRGGRENGYGHAVGTTIVWLKSAGRGRANPIPSRPPGRGPSAGNRQDQIETEIGRLREAAREAAQTSEAATDALNTLKHRSAELSSGLAATTEQGLGARRPEEARKRKTETEEELRGLPDIDAVKAPETRSRHLAERRRIQVERRADFDGLERAAADRERPLGSADRVEPGASGRRGAAGSKSWPSDGRY